LAVQAGVDAERHGSSWPLCSDHQSLAPSFPAIVVNSRRASTSRPLGSGSRVPVAGARRGPVSPEPGGLRLRPREARRGRRLRGHEAGGKDEAVGDCGVLDAKAERQSGRRLSADRPVRRAKASDEPHGGVRRALRPTPRRRPRTRPAPRRWGYA